MSVATDLIEQREGKDIWPPPEIAHRWGEAQRMAAYRESDVKALRKEQRKHGMAIKSGSPFVPSWLPVAISRATAKLMVGEQPLFRAADAADQTRVDEIVRRNRLHRILKELLFRCSSDGDAYLVVMLDGSTPRGRKVPLIDWMPTTRVIPRIVHGDELIAADIVTEWTADGHTYRLLQTHTPGLIETTLHVGSPSKLGPLVPPADWPAGLQGDAEPFSTGLDELWIWRVSNGEAGRSDYAGLEPLLAAHTEALSIGHEVYRSTPLTVIVDEELMDSEGRFPAGVNVVKRSGGNIEGPLAETPPVQPIQGTFDLSGTTDYQRHLVEQVAGATLGSSSIFGVLNKEGATQTGTAKRLSLAPALTELAARVSLVQDVLAEMLQVLAQADQLDIVEGKDPVIWADVELMPTVILRDGLPVDELDVARTVEALDRAGAVSTETKVSMVHPDWTDAQQQEEVALIEEQQASAEPAGSGLPAFDMGLGDAAGGGLEPLSSLGAAAASGVEAGGAST